MKKTLFLILLFIFYSCSAPRPKNLGTARTKSTGSEQTTLMPCPEKPNCVTSYLHHNDRDPYLPPIRFKGFTSKIREKLLAHLKEESRVKIVKASESYIHAEYTSLIFRFVDDVEFYFPREGVLHFRAAARIGYSDLGVNKRRIKAIEKVIRKRF